MCLAHVVEDLGAFFLCIQFFVSSHQQHNSLPSSHGRRARAAIRKPLQVLRYLENAAPTERGGGKQAASDRLDSLLPLDLHLAPGQDACQSVGCASQRDQPEEPIHHPAGSASRVVRAPWALRAGPAMSNPGLGPGSLAGLKDGC